MTSMLANTKKFISLILFILLLSGAAFAGGTIQWPTACFFDSNGDPLSGGLLNSYAAGTSTRKSLYSDREATTAHTNPEVLDANGCTEVYGIGTYKLVLTDATAASTYFTDDNVTVSAQSVSYFYPNYNAADQGATGNSDTLKYAIDTCSTNKCTIVLQHNSGGADTTYMLGTSNTAGSNIDFKFESGALIQPAAGISLTVYSPANIISQPNQQIVDTTNSFTNPLLFTVPGRSFLPWFGATGDGSTDDTTALLCAINSGAIFVHAPGGTYAIQSEGIDVTGKDLVLSGDGPGITTLDFQALGGGTGLFDMTLQGTVTQIADPTLTIAVNSTSIDFDSAHGLSVGDIFILYNTEDYSFGKHAAYYRQGEWCVVKTVTDEDTVVVTKPTYAAYASGDDVDAYLFSPIRFEMRNLSITPRTNSYGPKITNSWNVRISDVEMTGTSRSFLSFHQVYDAMIEKIKIIELADAGLYNYGVVIASGQHVTVQDSNFRVYGNAHSVTTGASTTLTLPNRDITYENLSTNGSLNHHQNIEYSYVRGCYADGGMYASGDHGVMEGNTFGWESGVSYLVGLNWRVVGNTFRALSDCNNVGFLFSTLDTAADWIKRDSLFIFANNILDLNGHTGEAFEYGLITAADSYNVDIVMQGNVFSGGRVFFNFQTGNGGGLGTLKIDNNDFYGDHLLINDITADKVTVSNNDFYNGFVQVLGDSKYTIDQLVVKGNTATGGTNYNYFYGARNAIFKGNTFTNCNNTAGTTTEKSNLYITGIETAVISDNEVGDTRKAQIQTRTIVLLDIVNAYVRDNTTLGNWITHNLSTVINPYYSLNAFSRQREFYFGGEPNSATWLQGDVVWYTAPVAGAKPGYVCVTSGTAGTLNGGATTGDTISGESLITGLNSLTGLVLGAYIDAFGVTDLGYITKMIDAIGSTTVDASSASGQTVLNVTATTNFTVGETIVIDRAGAGAGPETGVIDSIQDGVSLTLSGNLSGTYTNETVENVIVTSVAADATVDDAAVSFSAAVFKEMADIDA